nr:CatA-like O-acetyltransferase [Maliibacterium massiliense]
MAYKVLSMDAYPRSKHFAYFKDMAQPYVGVTVQVDITGFYARVKKEGLPFFLSFLYLVSHAANAVPELRQRINGEGIIEYQRCPTSHTLALPDNTYCYCKLESDCTFEAFLTHAAQAQARARAQQSLEDTGDARALLFISTLPWLTYESLIQPVPAPADSNPRITWGRCHRQGDQVLMPVSILCHHALVDGRHIAQFYQHLQEEMLGFAGRG